MNTDHVTGFASCLMIVGIILAIVNLAVAWYLDDLLQEVMEIEADDLMDTVWATTEDPAHEVR
jgi:hypothetical protein